MLNLKNIVMAIIVLVLLMHLPEIVNTVSGIVIEFIESMRDAWQAGAHMSHYRGGDNVTAIAKLAVLGIVAVGIVKLLKRR